MIVSLMTAALTLVNAAAFVLLSQGRSLVDYIACSSIYGVSSWIILWILPSAWNYRADRLAQMRQAQLIVLAIACVLLVAVRPAAVAFAFAGLLILETWIFFPALLLIQQRTRLYQRIEFCRACGNSMGLILILAVLRGSPAAYAGCLVLVTSCTFLCAAAWAHVRPPALRWRGEPLDRLRDDAMGAFASRHMHALLISRAIEVGTLLLLSRMNALGAIVAVKLGLVLGNAIATNARRYRFAILLALAAILYAAGLAAIFAMRTLVPHLVPGALRALTTGDALSGGGVALLCLGFTLSGIGTRRTSPE